MAQAVANSSSVKCACSLQTSAIIEQIHDILCSVISYHYQQLGEDIYSGINDSM